MDESSSGGGGILATLTDKELTTKIQGFQADIYTFGNNLPEDGEIYFETLDQYQNEANRRKETVGYKIEDCLEEPSHFHYEDHGEVSWSEHNTVDGSLSFAELLKHSLEEKFPKDKITPVNESYLSFLKRSKKHYSVHPPIQRASHTATNSNLNQRDRTGDFELFYPSSSELNAAPIRRSDLACLDPQTYVSDEIINFCIRYFQDHEREVLVEKKIHIFNTFFYPKLDDKQTSYRILRSGWEKSISLFETRYMLFPIYFGDHWSLGIICVPTQMDEIGPLVLHLDSYGTHKSPPIFENIKKLFEKEWAFRMWEGGFESLFSFNDIKCITAEVPQQQNPYDSGLFVLKYMERFILEVPSKLFNMDVISMIKTDWFNSKDASSLRGNIRKFLVQLIEEKEKATKSFSVDLDKQHPYLVDNRWWNSSMKLDASNSLRGFMNLGNTCYMSSAIQCLIHTPDFVNNFLEDFEGSDKKGELAVEFAALLRDLKYSSGQSSPVPYSPNSFMSRLSKLYSDFAGTKQQDSHEFLMILLNRLHEDLNSGDDSIVARMFQLSDKEYTACSGCSYIGEEFSASLILSLPVPDTHLEVTLDSCVQNLLQGNFKKRMCLECNKEQPAKIRLALLKLPAVLIIHLKRYTGGENPTKLETFIQFPIDDLDLTRYSNNEDSSRYHYQLYAVTNHYGRYGGGHYDVYAQCGQRGWYAFDDSEVRPLGQDNITTCNAYLLFYKRI